MRRHRDGVPENVIDLVGRTSQQACQRPVRGFLSPLTEQMEDEEQRRRLRPFGRRKRQKRIDLAKEDRDDLLPLLRCRLQGRFLASPLRGLAG